MAYHADMTAPVSARNARTGNALSGTEVIGGPFAPILIAINRFTSKGKYGNTVFDVATGSLPDLAALTAAMIYQSRMLLSVIAVPDPNTVAQMSKVSAAVKGGYPTAQTWVKANMANVVQILNAFADAQGLPQWKPGDQSRSIPAWQLGLAAVALVGVTYFATRRRG